MAALARRPKNFNRCMVIDIGTSDAPEWVLIADGISSRANNISESKDVYYYFSGRGAAESETSSQEVGVSFSGHRIVGDAAQDHVFNALLFDLDKRELSFMDYDDTIPIPESGDMPVNGYKGRGSVQITDFGSGEAKSRQNIGFTINFIGRPEWGTVKKDADGNYTFVPKV